MPEEQPNPSESKADNQEPNAGLSQPQASGSGQSPTLDVPAQAESTATTPDSSVKTESINPPSNAPRSAPKPQREESKGPASAASPPSQARKPNDVPSKTARPTSGQGPKSKPAKESKSKADDAQDAAVGDSKIEAVLTQLVGAVGKVLGAILSAIGNQVQKSSFYSKIEPVVKVIRLLWNNVIVLIGNVVIKPIWGLGLKVLRGRFPEALKSFSDRFLTIVILSLATLIYWVVSSLIPPSQPAVQQPPAPAPVAKAPAAQPAAQPTPVSPPPSTPVAEAPVEEPPPPEPERKQIIEVQSQVAQVFDQYSQDIVQSVQANFQAERLVIQVSDRWFELSRSEQNQLGTDVLERSRKLDFPKLEIRDQADQLLAREPVVGPNIIVLQRRTAPPELAPDSPA
ncbi:hypothetical protein [Acaryochloris sp. IP29b_bin.148]|uniref:hypothetical protein n=1 Tax=Acaryochloris sp. IP29b_bin.148 TaxID=2969218 RepID=UPI00260CF40C|nr:hypothetical protein [Acaryochloris sp. IP29b_bin.148]